MGVFMIELFPYLLALAQQGGNIIEALQWADGKAKHWNATGTEPTDADIAEIRARRHANNAIIDRG